MLSRCSLLFAVYIYISEVRFLTVVSNVIVSTLSITSQMNGNSVARGYIRMKPRWRWYWYSLLLCKRDKWKQSDSVRLKTSNGSNWFNSNMAKSLINFWNQFVFTSLPHAKWVHKSNAFIWLMLFREHSSVFWSRRQVYHRKNFSMTRLRLRHSKN